MTRTEFLPMDPTLGYDRECQWFPRCVNESAYLASHPVLEWVPVCTVHREWLEKIEEELARQGVFS